MEKNEKLNTQTPELEAAMEKLQRMTLLDDFLFDVATVDLENCKIIIELSLGIRIKEIRWKEGQKVIHNLPGRRGIRMDFYVEDIDGNIFNVEMQKRNEGNIPKRMRFYQAMLDAPMLSSGEKSFDNLHPTYIIVICDFDLYHKGLYRYTFENICAEYPGLVMGDECTKVVLNTKGQNDSNVEQTLIDFLHYIGDQTSSLPIDCDERLRLLHDNLKKIKCDNQMGVEYMKMEERDRLLREEGNRKHLIMQVIKKCKKGKSLEIIADELEEELEAILPIYDAVKQHGADCEVDAIYELVYLNECSLKDEKL